MSDGWEKAFGGKRREVAALSNFERSFTKASTLNWGTKSNPAPTLRIVEGFGSTCHGIAFEFDDGRSSDVFGYLTSREGKGFERVDVQLTLSSGEEIAASTYRYGGNNLIETSDPTILAGMAQRAEGTKGRGTDYILQAKEALAVEGLNDPVVDSMARAVGHKGMTILRHELLKVGDIILTTSSEPMSAAIRTWTKSDISHAMICVDTGAVIDATAEGVHGRNTQRTLFDDDRAVHVLRLKSDLSPADAAAICEFVRQRIGTRYSKREAARVVTGGGTASKDRQFCSRLVAQAYASRGYNLVGNTDYCAPDDLLHSDLLREIEGCLRPATKQDIAFAGSADPVQLMRDVTETLLKGARVKNADIANVNGINEHLMKVPGDDAYMHENLRKSGYLNVWRADIERNPWHYDFDLMETISDEAALTEYCTTTAVDAGDARYRFALNASEYAKLAAHYKLATFEEMAGLYAHLQHLHQLRRLTAAMWLAKHRPGLVSPRVVLPHSAEWFREMVAVDETKLEITKAVLAAAGGSDVCSICGDEPALDYQLAGEYLPGELVPTLRLCEDDLRIREAGGEAFVRMAVNDPE
jgi:cation transport regulator ChaC